MVTNKAMLVSVLWALAAVAAVAFPDRPMRERKHQLTPLIMQQSCYYQEYNKRLTCKCEGWDTRAYLYLRMKYYVFKRGNEIRSVHLEHCEELLISLDLRDVDATNFPIHFRYDVNSYMSNSCQLQPQSLACLACFGPNFITSLGHSGHKRKRQTT